MASTILEAFCAVTPLLPQLMTQRVGMVVADREKWVAANSIEELAATVVVGEAVKPEAAVAVAMRERRRVVVQVKKEVYGVPYVAVSIPLEEGGKAKKTVDERIAEGAMYAKMLALWNKLLNDPVQLEQPPAKVFYDEGHEYHLPAPQKRMGKVNAGTAVQA